MVCGIALMYGSVGSWVHVSGSLGIADFHASINGIDPGISTLIGVNGWVDLHRRHSSRRLRLLRDDVGGAAARDLHHRSSPPPATVFAVYDMFSIVQKISQVPAPVSANVSVGWGLICVLSAAVLATLIAIVKLIQR